MLIYNSQKEFIGIDTKDLHDLGYETLADLQIEASDFSDLFLRTPGHIHNFKYVHWIDYITFGGSAETPKAIIHTQHGDFSCTLSIDEFYVTDSPASKAYAIHLHNLKKLSQQESEQLLNDIAIKPKPISLDKEMIPDPFKVDTQKIQNSIQKQNAFFAGKEIVDSIEEDIVPELDSLDTNTPDSTDKITSSTTKEKNDLKEEIEKIPEVEETIDLKEETIDLKEEIEKIPEVKETIDLKEEIEKIPEIKEAIDLKEKIEKIPEAKEKEVVNLKENITKKVIKTTPLQAVTQIVNLQETKQEEKQEIVYKNDYVYDPQVASDELGLPVDLIEEFIEDFIAQAYEFKDDMYKSIQEKDKQNLRTLAHKLKGVAANLRIEDALEVLVVVNTTDDLNVAKTNLDYLYIIIRKLDNKEELATTQSTNKSEIKPNDEDFVLDFKDDIKNINTVAHVENNYNREEVAKSIGLDLDTFNELFNEYLSDAEDILYSMHQLIESDDLIHLKKHIVRLEGMNRNMKIDCFSDELKTLLDTSSQKEARDILAIINTHILSMKD